MKAIVPLLCIKKTYDMAISNILTLFCLYLQNYINFIDVEDHIQVIKNVLNN